MTARPRLLFISHDPVGAQMRGLGIRYRELARVFAADADVTVAHGGTEAGDDDGVTLAPFRPHDPRALRALIAGADTVVAHPQWPLTTAWLRRSDAQVVFDLYDPETLETLELFARRSRAARRLMAHTTLDRLHDALRTGHRFVCASEKQRDLWLGTMLGLRLIDPDVYARDPSLRSVIDTVPFGVPAQAADAAGAPGPRERFAGRIGPHDEIVLWNGGIWPWLDAPTAVRAVAELAVRRPSVRLVFMGGSTADAARGATAQARGLARELGALDRTVLFNDHWVPYAHRAAWLRQAACALSTHPEHLETRFAFRTRLLDCFWAGVPIVCTSGDDLAERVARDDLGATVAPGDHVEAAAAIERVLDRGRDAYAERLATAARDHAWTRVAEPLRRWALDRDRPVRPGAAPGAARRTPGHAARTAAYRLGGRVALALSARRRRTRAPGG